MRAAGTPVAPAPPSHPCPCSSSCRPRAACEVEHCSSCDGQGPGRCDLYGCREGWGFEDKSNLCFQVRGTSAHFVLSRRCGTALAPVPQPLQPIRLVCAPLIRTRSRSAPRAAATATARRASGVRPASGRTQTRRRAQSAWRVTRTTSAAFSDERRERSASPPCDRRAACEMSSPNERPANLTFITLPACTDPSSRNCTCIFSPSLERPEPRAALSPGRRPVAAALNARPSPSSSRAVTLPKTNSGRPVERLETAENSARSDGGWLSGGAPAVSGERRLSCLQRCHAAISVLALAAQLRSAGQSGSPVESHQATGAFPARSSCFRARVCLAPAIPQRTRVTSAGADCRCVTPLNAWGAPRACQGRLQRSGRSAVRRRAPASRGSSGDRPRCRIGHRWASGGGGRRSGAGATSGVHRRRGRHERAGGGGGARGALRASADDVGSRPGKRPPF